MAALLAFDLSILPPNAHIVDATLSLWSVSRSNDNMATGGAYQINRPWQATAATWLQANDGRPWGQPGANAVPQDRSAEANDTVTIDTVGRWYDWRITNLAQQWLHDPQTNHGVILKAFSQGNVLYTFASAEFALPAYHPKLTIHYWIPNSLAP